MPTSETLKTSPVIQTSQPNPYGSEWSAIDSRTYDVDWQGEEDGYVANGPTGWGKTEAEAIADLKEQLAERGMYSHEALGLTLENSNG